MSCPMTQPAKPFATTVVAVCYGELYHWGAPWASAGDPSVAEKGLWGEWFRPPVQPPFSIHHLPLRVESVSPGRGHRASDVSICTEYSRLVLTMTGLAMLQNGPLPVNYLALNTYTRSLLAKTNFWFNGAERRDPDRNVYQTVLILIKIFPLEESTCLFCLLEFAF